MLDEKKQGSEEAYEKMLKGQDIKKMMAELKKKIEEAKKVVDSFKEKILKKYSFISAISLLPPEASKLIEENEEVEKEKGEKVFHVIVIVPDENIKDIPKLKVDSIQLVKDKKPKLWLHFYTMSSLWQVSLDSKYELLDAIALSLPVYDTGILGSLRVATIHKIMILKKFEKYVVSYVLAGSVVRGEATKTSDVDVYIVIDDTDVKRMSRLELKERLRAIIYSYAMEANERANAKNKLSPQIYILTEFWEAVKDAHPVIFTFIRDGIPLYDRGAFMPWKLLLRMGKIKPSPEAIDMFMALGEKVIKTVKAKLNDIVTEDIYWGVITPSQAALMLYGIAPPTPKETVKLMNEIFVEKEHILEKKYVDTLKKIVELYKGYEHQKVKQVSGKEVDSLIEQVSAYMERLKELMDQISEKSKHRTLLEMYDSVFSLLTKIFGKHSEKEIIDLFRKQLVDKALIDKRYSLIIERLLKKVKEKPKSKKEKSSRVGKKQKQEKQNVEKKKETATTHEFELLRKSTLELLRELREYVERKEVLEKIKKRIIIKQKDKKGEIIPSDKSLFIIPDITKDSILKYNLDKKTLIESTRDELNSAILKNQKHVTLQLPLDFLEKLKQKIGDFMVLFGE